MALGEINGSGGINGQKIELVIEDEQGKKEEAINVFKKLIFQDKVLMLFGPTLSNSAQASDPVAQAAKVVVFGTSNTADGITSIGNYVFRNSVTEADILPVTFESGVAENRTRKKSRCSTATTIFSPRAATTISKKRCRSLKIPVTTTETFAKGDVDFKPQLTKIKASNPDAIVLVGFGRRRRADDGAGAPVGHRAAVHRRQRHELAQGIRAGQRQLGQPLGRQPVVQLRIRRRRTRRFIAAYQKAHTTLPDQFAAQAYDAMYIVAQALRR